MGTAQFVVSPSKVLGSVTKLIHYLEKEEVSWSDWLHPINNIPARRNLAHFLKLGCPPIEERAGEITLRLPSGDTFCRCVLGDDYISPADVAETYGWEYSEEQINHLADTMPDFDTVMWLQEHGYMLVASPVSTMNLLEVRETNNDYFYTSSRWREDWYAKSCVSFSRDDLVAPAVWLMIAKDPHPGSQSKKWSAQTKTLDTSEYVPNAAEVAYVFTTYFRKHGMIDFDHVLHGKCIRTSSIDLSGNHVLVDLQGEDGLSLSICADKTNKDHIGIASAKQYDHVPLEEHVSLENGTSDTT